MRELARVIAVIALVALAAALATPPGRLPLALRGLAKIVRRDSAVPAPVPPDAKASPARRFAAFILVVLAALLAVI